MSKPLKLTLTNVTCQDEQVGEPGKDEIGLGSRLGRAAPRNAVESIAAEC
jgi:hypothetical protein